MSDPARAPEVAGTRPVRAVAKPCHEEHRRVIAAASELWLPELRWVTSKPPRQEIAASVPWPPGRRWAAAEPLPQEAAA